MYVCIDVGGGASNARGSGAVSSRELIGSEDREEDLKNIEDERKRGTADLKDSESPTTRQAEGPPLSCTNRDRVRVLSMTSRPAAASATRRNGGFVAKRHAKIQKGRERWCCAVKACACGGAVCCLWAHTGCTTACLFVHR